MSAVPKRSGVDAGTALCLRTRRLRPGAAHRGRYARGEHAISRSHHLLFRFCSLFLLSAIGFATITNGQTNTRGAESFQKLRKTIYPMPATNEVVQALPGWLWLCQRLGVNPGAATNVSEVDWNTTLVYTNWWLLSTNDMACRIVFKTGAAFLSIRGAAVNYTAPDASTESGGGYPYYDPPPLSGTIKYKWQDLAKRLENTLTSKLGIPKKCLAPYSPRPGSGAALAALGSRVRERRATILWTEPKHDQVQGCGAEFDLETGELKELGFTDRAIAKALAQAQGKPF